ncbi:disease resistance protein RGA4-like [Triticum urartu]|uniref:disease resistance protein RGA4-like n=1 Tax=Triticum urartu TaxID=4572 RepID=UPI0020435825|nr:disease resistance protein RGA4-like [Triticum urartu]
MEVGIAVATAVTRSVVSKLLTVIEKRWRELKDLEDDIGFLHRELTMISGSMEVQISHKGQPSAVEIISMEDFRDLAHNIEDCLDRFLPCGSCEGESIRDAKKFCAEIVRLKRRLDEAHQRRERHSIHSQASADAVSKANHSNPEKDTGTHGACPAVGMEEPKQELWESLFGGQASKLRVISIVGFGGSGKTALAWEVYNCPQVTKQFSCRAWAVASNHNDDATTERLLTAILEGLDGEAAQPVPQKLRQLQQCITRLLETKRCLIVIDDIKMEFWTKIKHIFPEKTESRILVTTAVTSVANACSLPDGYVYSMRSLSAKQSKDYIEQKVFVDQSTPDLQRGSTAIVDKCDGHPLALVSVAKALQDHNVLTGVHCEEISNNLCSRMDVNKNGHFTKLRQVLMNNYSSLPDNSFRACLQYTSIFPNDRPFSMNSLIRRLSAEGYIEGKHERSDLEVAYDNMEELIDRNIIQRVDASNNAKVKTCRPHKIMNQFMLHKSRSSDFISTSFGDKNRINCRHLVIQNHRNGISTCRATSGKGKQLRPRSLTVFGSAGKAISDLKNCELLRVLDLKECNDLKDQHLEDIYKLLHLKYLTLGSSVSQPLDGMEKLHYLETLDLRKRKTETLPVEVISLPHLVHVFGKIKLKKLDSKKLNKFLSGECNLETLAGVIVDSNSGFPELMIHMKQLTKVKIWCEPTVTDNNKILDPLSVAIQKFIKARIDTPVGARRRLSLHLNHYSKSLLQCLDKANATSTVSGNLSSLKMQGVLRQFPQFVISQSGLRELCLTSTNLTAADLLKNLRKLRYLVYLKLVEASLTGFWIQDGDFLILQRLCLVVEKPTFPTIEKGALTRLTSMQLLCKGLVGLCDIKIEYLRDIQEIALDSMVSCETIKVWENEAKKHPKRPRILLLKRVVDPAETMPSGKYVSSCQVNNNCYSNTCAIHQMEIELDSLSLQQKGHGSDQFQAGQKRPRPPHFPGSAG